jgi:hypothetical protein
MVRVLVRRAINRKAYGRAHALPEGCLGCMASSARIVLRCTNKGRYHESARQGGHESIGGTAATRRGPNAYFARTTILTRNVLRSLKRISPTEGALCVYIYC